MNKTLYKAAAFLLSGVLSLSMLAGCAETPPASTDTPVTPDSTSENLQTQPEATINPDALVIAEQGVFSAGGITLTSDGTFDPENQWEESGAGQTAHVDHANVLYQIPENETGLPMVFLHGYGQSRVGWMTTPDGRDGWSNLFLKKGHSVFLVDQPRRGAAGATSVSGTISTKTLDQRWYTQFRIGRWENGTSVVNEGSQFPNDADSVDQFFRQMTPDTGMSSDMGGDFDNETVAKALAATVDEVYSRTSKKSILVTHSQGGGPGWTAAQYTNNIAAIVAIEPGGAPPADSDAYKAVTEQNIPVTFYFGDYIDNGDPAIAATGMWQGMREACYQFAAAYTAEGGNCTVVDLPKEGITGNDHFIFQDLNNDVVADHVEFWIQENVTEQTRSISQSQSSQAAQSSEETSASENTPQEPQNSTDDEPESTSPIDTVPDNEEVKDPAQSSDQSQSSQATLSSEETSSSESSSTQTPQSSTEAVKSEATPPTDLVSESEENILVIYFSATGNTKAVAEVIAASTGGELYEIVPESPYTSDDLDWTIPDSRVTKEHEDTSFRPAIAGGAKDLSGYDTIFIGYPLWWGEAPNIVWNFVESNDLSGKTVIPFATSSSSGFGSSGETLKGFAPNANWLDGQRFSSGAPESSVQDWVDGLNIN